MISNKNKVPFDYWDSSSLSDLLPSTPLYPFTDIFCFCFFFFRSIGLTRIFCVTWSQHWSLELGGLISGYTTKDNELPFPRTLSSQ